MDLRGGRLQSLREETEALSAQLDEARAQTAAAAEKADAVITVSENSKKDILRFTRVREERIHVIREAPKPRAFLLKLL